MAFASYRDVAIIARFAERLECMADGDDRGSGSSFIEKQSLTKILWRSSAGNVSIGARAMTMMMVETKKDEGKPRRNSLGNSCK
jgi:hypothetical protein